MSSKALYDLTLKISANSAELSKGIKEANQKIDGFQKNVAGQLKAVQTAFLSAAAVIGALKGVLETLKAGFNATGEGADFLEKKTVALKTGFQQLAKSIIDADFANLLQNFKAGAQAGEKYAESIDGVKTRINDLSVLQASLSSRVAVLRVKQQEGTISRAEVTELEQTTKQLMDIEKDIYDEAIQAQLKFIANKNKLDENLLSSVSNGIAARAQMSREELAELNKTNENYDKFYTDLVNKYTTIADHINMGPGMNNANATMVTNWTAVNKELQDYIGSLSDVEKAQIAENKLSNPEEWNKLIEFLVKRNNLEGEYAMLLRRIGTASKQVKQDTPPINRVEGISGISTSNIALPTVAPAIDTTKLALIEPAKAFEESWTDAAQKVASQVTLLQNAFETLGSAIVQASEDGKISFSESMNIMSQAAMSLISVMQALAIAGVIKNEAVTKGLVGVLTAAAGIASIISLFAQYTKPKEYASGTNYSAGGWSLVGERGPELLNLPRGSQVLSNAETSRAFMGGKVVFELGNGVLTGALKQDQRFKRSYA